MSEIDAFMVNAGRDGELYIQCPETDPYCCWEPEIPNGTTIAELRSLAATHIGEDHRTIEGDAP